MSDNRKNILHESVAVVGNNIKNIMKDKGIKARQVSEKADMDVETFRKYCNASFEMGISKAVRIAHALEVEVGELFKGL